MGVFISRDKDSEMYRETYDEAQRIIRISEEVRISLQKVEKSKQEEVTKPIEQSKDDIVKLTSSKLASKHKIKTTELMEKLALAEYVIKQDNGEYLLTDKGTLAGAEAKKGRFGNYIIWPENLTLD